MTMLCPYEDGPMQFLMNMLPSQQVRDARKSRTTGEYNRLKAFSAQAATHGGKGVTMLGHFT